MLVRNHRESAPATTRRALAAGIAAVAFVVFAAASHADPAAPSIANGAKLYARIGCAQCHGTIGQGGIAGPSLVNTALPYSPFAAQTRTPRAEMPPYTAKVLSDSDLADIYAFVKTLKP